MALSEDAVVNSKKDLKIDLGVEIAAMLSFSAIKNNDKVGLILFSDQIEKFIPPNKGKSHVLRVIRELIYYKTEDKKTKISEALEYSLKALKRKSVIFLLSDFLKDEKILLAGGLDVENVNAGIEKFSPFGVDVATGIESEPGRKDPKLLKLFIENAKSSRAGTDQ